jgi:hypothetical protein
VKRLVVLTTGLVLALAAGAVAFVQTDFAGGVKGQPSSILGFDVDHNANGKRIVTGLILARIDYTCDNSSGGSSGGYSSTKRFRVIGPKWTGKQHITESGLDPLLHVSGKLVGGGKARGIVRLRGNLDPDHPDAQCDTGTVGWKATRTAQPG